MHPCDNSKQHPGQQKGDHFYQVRGGDPSPLFGASEENLECWFEF